MTIEEMVRAGVLHLRAAGLPDADRDARRLLDGLVRHSLSIVGRDDAAAISDRYEARIAARAAHRPVSHILGERDFWTHRFEVNGDVLDPRPETERLVEEALKQPFETVLDLGTGSGAILLSLLSERPDARGLGTDISQLALNVAQRNAARLNVTKATFQRAHWLEGVSGKFDLIVSNPPYIAAAEMADLSRTVREWEPHLALTPGGDGLAAYREIAQGITGHLNPRARILLEIGPTQATEVSDLFARFGPVAVHRDLDGRDRVVEVQTTG